MVQAVNYSMIIVKMK